MHDNHGGVNSGGRREKLTCLRKELKSAGKERRKQIKLEIAELETDHDCHDEQPEHVSCGDKEKMEAARAKKVEKAAQAANEREKTINETRNRISQNPQPSKLEQDQLDSLFRQHNVQIFHINPDGNCLFAAISHQLSLLGRTVAHNELRRMAADHIQLNADKYIPFIDFEGYNVADLPAYLELVRSLGWWGGELEIEALSSALAAHISVFKSDGLLTFGNEQDDIYIKLSFHQHQYALGCHYNSLINI